MNAFHARSTVIDPKSVTRFWIGHVSELYEPKNKAVSEFYEEPDVFKRSRTLRTAFEKKELDFHQPFVDLEKLNSFVTVFMLQFIDRALNWFASLLKQRKVHRELHLGSR